MEEFQEIPSIFLSVSSSENQDSVGSLNDDGGDEEFYEKIEAPKFVDFTVPDHYSPDDRYWFCLRVGCDQKHEEELDSEAIYNNFVLRVMAARSPNVRLRKALDRNASRTPIKCPLSAPPKSSKPRLSRMAVISSIYRKMAEDKKKVVQPLLKPGSTPVTKMKPVAAKYLTTPRNKKCTSDQSLFRSVQHRKLINVEVPKSRIVAKALVFRSPKKDIKVKTSVERTPISKLCQGMNRLEISSQRKHALGYSSNSSKSLSDSSSRRQLSSQKLQAKPEKPLQTCRGEEAKSGRLIRTKLKGQLSQQQESKKLLGSDETHSLKNKESCDVRKQLAKKASEESGLQESSDETHSLKNKESCDVRKQLAKKASEESGLQESSHEEALTHSTVPPATPDHSKSEVSCLDLEGKDDSKSQATKVEENNGDENTASESCVPSKDQFNSNNASEGEQSGLDFEDGDDKENAAASDENRIPNNTQTQNGRNFFGVHEKCDQVRKKVTQALDNLKESSRVPVTKLKKPKATNPKPFRLRTDERGILKEAVLDRRVDPPASQSENANVSTPGGKLQRKIVSNIQKGSTAVVLKTPKREVSKTTAIITPETNKCQERKLTSNAMQRLEKFRKLTSHVAKQRVRPHGVESRKQELISLLIPGQKLDVIHETSPQVSEPRSIRKPTGRRLITVAEEPKLHPYIRHQEILI